MTLLQRSLDAARRLVAQGSAGGAALDPADEVTCARRRAAGRIMDERPDLWLPGDLAPDVLLGARRRRTERDADDDRRGPAAAPTGGRPG